MSRCLITYEEISGDGDYSSTGLGRLNPALKELRPLPLDHREQLREARDRAAVMALPGLQRKMSARLSLKERRFLPVRSHGIYLLKPSLLEFEQVPENEDLTMRLAGLAGIEVPLHGLHRAADGSLLYFVRRFDRTGKAGRVHTEDLAQVAGVTPDRKFGFPLEEVARLLERHASFPMVDKWKLFRRVLFAWLTGNEEMHLKDLSLIHQGNVVALSPAYDLVNTAIVRKNPDGEMALSLDGRREGMNRELLFGYFGRECLELTREAMDRVANDLSKALPRWNRLIGRSFLDDRRKSDYRNLIAKRREVLGW
ncbi:MAG: HipA domain-containing protein [Balneolaceae bacterium]|nr:HipA domain-containing protein [Balneolaceae bacterium]